MKKQLFVCGENLEINLKKTFSISLNLLQLDQYVSEWSRWSEYVSEFNKCL